MGERSHIRIGPTEGSGRSGARGGLRALGLALLTLAALVLHSPRAAHAEPVPAEISVDTRGGFARFVFRFNEELEADVRMANSILVVSFKTPVRIVVDRLPTEARGYVNAARRDPDGMAVRMALGRKVQLHTTMVAERLFVDLLPDDWTGAPPPLPQEVVEELVRRTRIAEKKQREQELLTRERQMALTPVRVAHQPTFSRYVFELPELMPITTERDRDKLTLVFGRLMKLDLANAKSPLPPMIKSIESKPGDQSTAVTFSLIGKVDVRSFREDNDYVVDVMTIGANPNRATVIPPAASARPPGGEDMTGPSPAQRGDALAAPVAKPAAAAAVAPAAVPAPPPTAPSLAPSAPPPAAMPAAVPPAAAPRPAAMPLPATAPGVSPLAVTPLAVTPPAGQPLPAPVAPRAAQLLPALAAPPAVQPAAPPASPGAALAPPVPPAAAPAPPPAMAQADAPKPSAVPSPPTAPLQTAAPMPAQQEHRAELAAPSNPNAPIAAGLSYQGDNLKLTFPFQAPTPAAVFRRAETLWMVFDTPQAIDVTALTKAGTGKIRAATVTPERDGQVVRIILERPQLASFAQEGTSWIVKIGDIALDATQPLAIVRNTAGGARSTAIIPFDGPRTVYRLTDPEVGDTLFVVTAPAPARGMLKEQDFVEFRALASTHGVVIQPIADDLTVEIAADKIIVGRPGGLMLSAGNSGGAKLTGYRPVVFDSQLWGFDQEAAFRERQMNLINAAAIAPESKRAAARFELARFYLARDMYQEAKGVLDVALNGEHPGAEEAIGLVLRAVANIMMLRSEEALRDLANPLIGNQHDAQIWRAVAYTQQGKWAEARDGFRDLDTSLGTLPLELQRMVLEEALRTSIEARDFAAAANELNEFDQIGLTSSLAPAVSVLQGKLAEALGKNDDALAAYRAASDSINRPDAAQGRLRETALRYHLGDLKRDDVISDLETLTTIWRGDDTEIEALQLLARLYTEEARYRDAFHVMRTAIKAHANSDRTRRIQEEAAGTFDSLFLAGKGDGMPAVDALSLFYDYRELTPIGRRGDEMIRRLSDRLVSVDLLDQAAELLQHQVDHRLQGAARAQVATRLAVVYLMNHKPERALLTLNATRQATVTRELRNQRLLIEARALSDSGRTDVALEVIGNIEGREATRLRSDILWSAKRWREAAEQIELLYGDRWRDWRPLNDAERSDILRAAMGYALGEDKLGLDRFVGKYAAKMAEGPDRHAFQVLTSPDTADAQEFRRIARAVAATDTLEAFLREMRARYPETGAFMPASAASTPAPQSGAPRASPRRSGALAAPTRTAAR
ncbi:MAG TPA: tetratricopeptide repeat protein [Xanthobacteraceae bacterium]|nr:tetratricopeptide repeat protein [Xanthobacteraceae bacterium]